MRTYKKYGVARVIKIYDTDTYEENEVSCRMFERGTQKLCAVCDEYRDLETEFDEVWNGEKSDICNWCKED